jgi:hypothetical protein
MIHNQMTLGPGHESETNLEPPVAIAEGQMFAMVSQGGARQPPKQQLVNLQYLSDFEAAQKVWPPNTMSASNLPLRS